jgi:hypothetical protein
MLLAICSWLTWARTGRGSMSAPFFSSSDLSFLWSTNISCDTSFRAESADGRKEVAVWRAI